jgi:microcystin-dependent protein
MAKKIIANETIDGTLDVSGKLSLTSSAGDEGGELSLAKPVTNTSIAGTGVTVDVYQNKLRFFEQGGSARGYYIDIPSGAAGVGTNLAAGTTSAMNYAQTQATKQSGISASGVTIVSASITTNGYPVQVLVTGDIENSVAASWIRLQLYRGTTAIGKIIQLESTAAISQNNGYALTVIDTPAAGTYTYSLKTASAASAGTFSFGEVDGPVLTCIELSNKTGATGATGATGGTGPDGTPAGTIVATGMSTAPTGWLICDGSAISRSTYASLFSAIGTAYGAGDGSTTFNIPDLRGRVAVGKNTGTFTTLGGTGGTETHTHGSSTMTAGAYVGYWATRNGSTWTATNSGGFTAPGSNATSSNSGTAIFGNTDAGSSLQPYQVINYIIKHSAATTPGDSELATRLGALETANATTNKSAMVPVIPTGVSVTSGSGSYNSTTGVITFSAASTVNISGVFTADYDAYKVIFYPTSGSTSDYLYVRFRSGATTNATSNYYNGGMFIQGGTIGVWNDATTATTYSKVGYIYGSSDPTSSNFMFDFVNPYSSSAKTIMNYSTSYSAASHTYATGSVAFNGSTSFDGFTIGNVTSGTIGGTIQVYGMRKS